MLGSMSVSVSIINEMGVSIACLFNDIAGNHFLNLPPRGRLRCRVPNLPLMPGRYTLTLAMIVEGVKTDKISDAAQFTVIEGDFFGTGKLPPAHLGYSLIHQTWDILDQAR
jgi:lipopolysaccharide transport system ATP-binding protein